MAAYRTRNDQTADQTADLQYLAQANEPVDQLNGQQFNTVLTARAFAHLIRPLPDGDGVVRDHVVFEDRLDVLCAATRAAMLKQLTDALKETP